MNRRQKRALKKQVGSKTQEKMTDLMTQFSKLPQSCDACQKEFDKTNREMIQSWSVVVKQQVVRLFCPECIEITKEALNGSNQNL